MAGVRHEMDGERGDVRGADDAADRQRPVTAFVESIAEQSRRQWCVDEARPVCSIPLAALGPQVLLQLCGRMLKQ